MRLKIILSPFVLPFKGGIRRNGRYRALLLCSLLSACTGSGREGYNGPVQCAPYAREKTGIMLYGHAAWWWREARGRYRRANRPVSGAVMVFRPTRRMPYGHLAIVRKVEAPGRVLVDQANWLPGKIEHNVPVEDVSRTHNWSLVRVWWAPSHSPGSSYNPLYGFILPP